MCGKQFPSRYGKEVCSEQCFIVRKRLSDQKGNEKRKQGLSGQLDEKICPECGNSFEGLIRKYCPECSDQVRINTRKKLFKEYYLNNRVKIIQKVIQNRKYKSKV